MRPPGSYLLVLRQRGEGSGGRRRRGLPALRLSGCTTLWLVVVLGLSDVEGLCVVCCRVSASLLFLGLCRPIGGFVALAAGWLGFSVRCRVRRRRSLSLRRGENVGAPPSRIAWRRAECAWAVAVCGGLSSGFVGFCSHFSASWCISAYFMRFSRWRRVSFSTTAPSLLFTSVGSWPVRAFIRVFVLWASASRPPGASAWAYVWPLTSPLAPRVKVIVFWRGAPPISAFIHMYSFSSTHALASWCYVACL